jgi:hypothetical protein
MNLAQSLFVGRLLESFMVVQTRRWAVGGWDMTAVIRALELTQQTVPD